MQKLQATIAGYAGIPATVYGAVDPASGALVISRGVDSFQPRKGPDFMMAGSPGNIVADVIFHVEDMGAAIAAWRQLQSMGRLLLEGAAGRYNPDSHMQLQKVRTGGQVYEIAPDVGNGQVASLVLAWMAVRQEQNSRLASFASAVNSSIYRVDGNSRFLR